MAENMTDREYEQWLETFRDDPEFHDLYDLLVEGWNDPAFRAIDEFVRNETHEYTDEEFAEMHRRRFPPLYPFDFQHWTFDVLDGGTWYRIDARVPESEFYDGVPERVQRRARAAIKAVIDAAIDAENGHGYAPTTILCDQDHTEEYESILRTVFDDVRFVETDYCPGIKF